MNDLRILQLISSGGFYGAENVTLQLTLALNGLGRQVIIGAFENAQRRNSELAKAARHRGIRVESIECKGRLDLQTVATIRQIILKYDINIVHTHGYKADIYGYLAARETKAKLVATCHNWTGATFSLRWYERLDRFFLRRFDAIAAVSGTIQDTLTRSGVQQDRVRIVENGIDIESFSRGQPILKNLPKFKNRKIVGFVGRLVREKGLTFLLEAAKSIVAMDSNVTFVLAGDGPDQDYLGQLVKEYGLEDEIVFLGPLSELPDTYASFDIFVLPSLNEGMPMAVLEAMASGRPVVATRIGAVPQLLQDGESGLLVSPGDATQLAAAIRRLLDSPALRQKLGAQGHQRVCEHFSAEAMAEKYLEIYSGRSNHSARVVKDKQLPEPTPLNRQLALIDVPQISVVIPAKNEQAVIGRCLAALANNDLHKNAFEVIVVDNGSTDDTVEIAKSFANILTVKLLALEGAHISALRNYGAAEARGGILAFLDSDCLAPVSWLSTACQLMQCRAPGVIGAHYQIPSDSTWVGRIWCEDRFAQRVGTVSYVPAGDLLIDRESFLAIGGFDETIQTNEDFELCERARSAGLPVHSFPELRVIHLGTPQTLGAFYRKQRWHGTHVFTVFLRDPQKRKNRRPVLLALYTCMCAVGMISAAWLVFVKDSWMIFAIFAGLLLTPLLGIALTRSHQRRKWSDAIPLTVLYLTFALARARAVLSYAAWRSRSRKNRRAVDSGSSTVP